jgi:hypothetical protein
MLSCETDDSQQGQKPLNIGAEGSTVLEAAPRQPVKTQQAEKTY